MLDATHRTMGRAGSSCAIRIEISCGHGGNGLNLTSCAEQDTPGLHLRRHFGVETPSKQESTGNDSFIPNSFELVSKHANARCSKSRWVENHLDLMQKAGVPDRHKKCGQILEQLVWLIILQLIFRQLGVLVESVLAQTSLGG